MEYPPLTRIQGVHRRSSLYHIYDGYFYSRSNVSGDSVYFRCSKSGSGCCATAVLRLGHFESSSHNHPPNHLHVPMMLERRRLINEASNLEYANFSEIFSSTSNAFPDVLTRHSLQPAMARMRSQALPNEPVTLRELDEILRDERYKCLSATTNFQDTIYAGSKVSDDGCFIILFLTKIGKEFIKLSTALFTLTTLVAIQGAGHHHVVHVIYTVWDGTFLILAWFIMEQVSEQVFIAALSLLKSVVEDQHFKTVVCRHGSPEIEAYRAVFAPVNITFCLQDFAESVGRFYSPANFPQQSQLLNFASLLCALPIVPYDFSRYGLEYIQGEIHRIDGLAEQAKILLEYVQSHSMNVMTEFTMCGDYHRLSDINDNVRRRVLRLIDTHKNSLFGLIRAIASILEVSQNDIVDLRCGKKVQHRRTFSLSDDKEIQELTRALVQPFGSSINAVANLLNATSLKIKHLLLSEIGAIQAHIQHS